MAVKVIVCGDSNGDYEFIVATAEKRRLFNEETLELLDVDGNLLYTVPMHSLRLIQIIPDGEVEPKKFQLDNSIMAVCLNNANSDAIVECTRASSERFVNEIVIETFNYLGRDEKGVENWFKEFIIPFKQIKYIDHNFIVDPNNTKVVKEELPAEPEQEITNLELEAVEENYEEQKKSSKPKHRFKKNS